MRVGCALIAALVPGVVLAMKINVIVTPPTVYDGTLAPLTDLASLQVEYGTCLADKKTFGTSLGKVTIPWTDITKNAMVTVSPNGANPACLRGFAFNSKGVQSAASPTITWAEAALGKPLQIGQPIQLPTTTKEH